MPAYFLRRHPIWQQLTCLTLITALLATPARAARSGQSGPRPQPSAAQPARDTPRASTASCDRAAVFAAWRTSGSEVRRAAERALIGSEADICAFEADWQHLAALDDGQRVREMASAGGPSVRAEAQRVLAAANEQAVDAYLTSGWLAGFERDRRLRIVQLIDAGGTQLQAAAKRALEATNPEALDEFLESGWRAPWELDQRLRVTQILNAGGPEVRALAQRALDANDVGALTHFIDVEWPVAMVRDDEAATIGELVDLAEDASALATRETEAAKAEAARAVAEASAAREAAEAAAVAAASAGDNAAQADAAADSAAYAANKAAESAQQAVSAAAAASDAARVASRTASRVAAAAARAQAAAARARKAAGETAGDASKAGEARLAAERARDAARNAQRAADAAARAGEAVRSAEGAANAANAAGTHAADAAQAAKEAGEHANSASAGAARTRAAAARAASNANRAMRAAQSAAKFAGMAASAAAAAQDAAERAVLDATAAAEAAESAAAHAGESADAALRATEHANAATRAAEAALDATTDARAVYDAARAAEAEQLELALEQGREAAQALNEEVARQRTAADSAASEAARRDSETKRLIGVVEDPATPPEAAVTAARRVALALANSQGAWTRSAAELALKGDGALAVEFVKTGLHVAAGQDDRAKLDAWVATGSPALRKAGEQALAGSDEDVARFLERGDYPARALEDRLSVTQLLSDAQQARAVATVRAAQQALDAGTAEALREFLARGRFEAAAADRRVQVTRVLQAAESGAEVRVAAQIALDGPPVALEQFLDVGQHAAARRDYDRDAHQAAMLGLLERASQAAANAAREALEAQEVAATARHAAEEAVGYALQAEQSALQATSHAEAAQRSAERARQSAVQAAASAATARNAAVAANESARLAASSAVWATASARNAVGYAQDAYGSAKAAYDSAIAAGKDARTALSAANAAIEAVKAKTMEERAQWAYKQASQCDAPFVDRADCLKNIERTVMDPLKVMYVNANACAVVFEKGSVPFNNCVAGALSPTFALEQGLVIATAVIDAAAGLFAVLTAIEVGIVVAGAVVLLCNAVCAAILEVAGPLLAPELIGMPVAGYGLLAGTAAGVRTAAVLERAAVEAKAEEAALARVIRNLSRCGLPGNSFTAGTQVLLADGTSRAIDQLQVGDSLVSTNPFAQSTPLATRRDAVTEVIRGQGDKRLVELTIDLDGSSGDATGLITATAEHRFWEPSLLRWVAAEALQPGQHVATLGGSWLSIASTGQRNENTNVYNLSVAEQDTFYVLAGSAPVLVHNDDVCPSLALGIDSRGLKDFARQLGLPTLMNAKNEIEFREALAKVVYEPGAELVVSLRGFTGATPLEQFQNAAILGFKQGLAPRNFTNYEMSEIARAIIKGKRTWESVKFYAYEDGKWVRVFVPEPDWNAIVPPYIRAGDDVLPQYRFELPD